MLPFARSGSSRGVSGRARAPLGSKQVALRLAHMTRCHPLAKYTHALWEEGKKGTGYFFADEQT